MVYVVIDTCPDNGGTILGIYASEKSAREKAEAEGPCFQVFEYIIEP